MTQQKHALLSVTDKRGLATFAKGLVSLGYSLLSTGGTAQLLKDEGIPCTQIDQFTGHPEVFGGRVKTLHPKVHGGILFDRADQGHVADAQKLGIVPIDLVCVNLYDFAKEAHATGKDLNDAIHHIDIGGPAMLRAAAKNHAHCTVVIDPSDYESLLREMEGNSGQSTLGTRVRLAGKVFAATSSYDAMIAESFAGAAEETSFAKVTHLPLTLVQELRYGENPQQTAALLQVEGDDSGFANVKVLQGKDLSYNNFLDMDAAAALCREFSPNHACVIVKHTNPCGVATSASLPAEQLFLRALAGDPKSAFGGIVAFNHAIDESCAKAMLEVFFECILAPAFLPEALALFQIKKNLRLVVAPWLSRSPTPQMLYRSITGAVLAQEADLKQNLASDPWRVVTKTKPDPRDLQNLAFAMTVCKHVKSNAIVFTKDERLLAAGGGQTSRIDAARFAVAKAEEFGHDLADSYLASDAFFPFADTVELAAKAKVKAIIQPGGSMRDEESVAAAEKAGIIMVMTGTRHFRH